MAGKTEYKCLSDEFKQAVEAVLKDRQSKYTNAYNIWPMLESPNDALVKTVDYQKLAKEIALCLEEYRTKETISVATSNKIELVLFDFLYDSRKSDTQTPVDGLRDHELRDVALNMGNALKAAIERYDANEGQSGAKPATIAYTPKRG